MSTSAAVRAAWKTYVFDTSNVQALTEQIYNYDVLSISGQSTEHAALLREDTEIDFIQYSVNKAFSYGLTGAKQEEFTVGIQYYKAADKLGSAYNAIEDAFAVIDTAVSSSLGSSWQSTVDFYRPQDGIVDISVTEISNVATWLGTFTYYGFNNTSL